MATNDNIENLDWLCSADEAKEAAERLDTLHAYLTDGGWITARLTTEHPSSSYGIPVLVCCRTGQAYGIAEATVRLRSNIHSYNAAIAAGYSEAPAHLK